MTLLDQAERLIRSLMKWHRCLIGAAWMVVGLVVLTLSGTAAADDRPDAGAAVPAVLAAVVGAGALLYGSWILFSGWRQIQSTERLRVEGLPAGATVTAIERTREVRINNQRLWIIRYRYEDHNGRAHAGESGPLFHDEVEGWEVGAAATVRYDPHSPHVSAFVGKPDAPDPRAGATSS